MEAGPPGGVPEDVDVVTGYAWSVLRMRPDRTSSGVAPFCHWQPTRQWAQPPRTNSRRVDDPWKGCTAVTAQRLTDVHGHWTPTTLPNMAERLGDDRWPTLVTDGASGAILQHGRTYRTVDAGYWSLETRLAQLDELGIAAQILSPLPVSLPFWADGGAAGDFCQAYNEQLARAAGDHPGRFRAFGIVPLQDPALAVRHIGLAKELRLAGLEFGTWIGEGRDLADPGYSDVFAAAAEAGLPILLHPNAPSTFWRTHTAAIELGVGVGCETARAMAALHLAGTLSDIADLRLCLSHGGGAFLWLWPRFAGVAGRIGAATELPPGLYADTAGLDESQFGYLQGLLGTDRLLFGSDMPATPVGAVASLVETCAVVAQRDSWDVDAVTSTFLTGS
jgi:aminocarboxymuconate-semialdehyde decarboxylase